MERFFGRKKDIEYREAARKLADGNPKDAIDQLRNILEEKPKHVNAMVTLAVALIQVQKSPALESAETGEAMRLLDKAGEMRPKDPVPVFNKGVCLRDLGLLEEALESFEAALKLEKRLPIAIVHMAEINYELERWEDAVHLARLALIRDPGLEEALGWVPDAMTKAGYLDDEGNVIQTPWENEDMAGDWTRQ
jgi:tetratricopeptide (TPR) repeat protein